MITKMWVITKCRDVPLARQQMPANVNKCLQMQPQMQPQMSANACKCNRKCPSPQPSHKKIHFCKI